MEKTYSGACMALPERDEELFALINKTTADRRKEQEAEAARVAREMYLYSDAEPETERPRVDAGMYLGTAARLLLTAVFAGAIARGWCIPEFGLAGAVACGLWAVVRLRRKGHG